MDNVKLACSLEAAHGWCIGEYARSVARLMPGSSAAVVQVNSGVCICTGSGPFNFAVGLAMDGPISQSDLDEVEDFFRCRGLRPRIDVTPYTDPSLAKFLQTRGYLPSEYTSALSRRLEGDLPAVAAPEKVTVRWAEPCELDAWVDVLAKCFFIADPGPDRRANMAALFQVPNSLNVLAFADAELAGVAGGMIPDDLDVAVIFGSSVLPQFRNRGIHGAMLRLRLERAMDLGCKSMAVSATPGSRSEKNLIRCGFVPCYEKITYVAPQ